MLAVFATLSNEVGYLLQTNFAMITNFNLTVSNRGPYGFTTILPATNHAVLPLSVYRQIPNPDIFERVTNNTLVSRTNVLFERGLPLIAPQWYYTVTNRLFYAMVDSTSNVVVDIVAMDGLSMETNLIDVMTQVNPNAASGLTMSDFWRTGPVGNVGASPGMLDQIRLSRDFTLDPRGTLWRQYNAINVPRNAATNFDRFLTAAVVRGSETNMQAPFSPAQTILVTHRWQVDDPFVHYMASDYQSAQSSGDSLDIQANYPFYTTVAMTFPDIGVLNKRYRPWGGNRFPKTRADFVDADEPYTFNPAYKDPMIRWPDEWDFPTNKFGNVGWIGRVHRGTPWQTIYLKSGAPAPADWENRVGSVDTYPTNDWAFADLFTVHVDDNARRGLLSVNQHNSAAWAAVLAGMPVLITNLPPSGMFDAAGFLAMPQPQDQFIVPDGDAAYSGVSNEFTVIVEGINRWRAAQTNGVFTNIGSILATPQLSLGVHTNSPYIGDVVMAGNSSAQWRGQPVSDPMAERIPQQLLSLVTLEGVDIPARFAVYGWGQSLSPAPRSLVTTPGATFQLCTNYQVTGETLTKTIFRLEPRIVNTVPGGNTNPAVNLQLVIESFEYLQNP